MATIKQAVDIKSILHLFFPKTRAKQNLFIALIFGGSITATSLYVLEKWRKISQSYDHHGDINGSPNNFVKRKVAVNRIFLQRLWNILKIIIPSWKSTEFLHLLILTGMSAARTLLSIEVADVTGKNAQVLVERRFRETIRGIALFAALGIPASFVNAGLKYETSLLSLRFRKRLSEKVDTEYLRGMNYYKATYLVQMDTVDQRITADIQKFCDQLSDLYTMMFKPILDLLLVTHRLSGYMGIAGPLVFVTYYLFVGYIKHYTMPAFGRWAARDSLLEGKYRTAHQRLINNAEEIAFYDGGKKESTIVAQLFDSIYNHSGFVYWLKAIVGGLDNFAVKYGTSIAGYIILTLPIFFPPRGAQATVSERTMAYVRNRQLLINLGTAIGQLVLLSNKVTTFAGITSRVSELLEMIETLDHVGVKPFQIKPELEHNEVLSERDLINMGQWIREWKIRRDEERQREQEERLPRITRNGGGQVIEGKFIRVENVSIVSPDGKMLVEDLTFEVKPNQNVMVTGPNGSGKSSLFRLLGELWPLYCGTVVKPKKEDILFVPQKPYLVQGSLRDQIIYPHTVDDMKRRNITDDDLTHLMMIVDPSQTILSQYKWDEARDWFSIFSGGQKQRIATARLFYHRPLFALLDESTSAVNDDIEAKVYETCKHLGITVFTISHRPSLKRFHDYILRFDGRKKWEWTEVDHSTDRPSEEDE